MDNLTTACEFMKFNRSSNKLSACSRWKKHSLKVVRNNFIFFKKFLIRFFINFKDEFKYNECLFEFS